MAETSPSLLNRCRQRHDNESWQRLVELYTPFIHGLRIRHNIPQEDARDLAQEVLAIVARELPTFEYDPKRGTFRGWLRTITVNCLRAYWRSRTPRGTGDSDVQEMLNQLADPNSEASRVWDREHDQFVWRRLVELVKPEFEPSTWQAFCLVTLEGVKPAQAAKKVGITTNAVFIAKSRVMRRLKEEAAGLID